MVGKFSARVLRSTGRGLFLVSVSVAVATGGCSSDKTGGGSTPITSADGGSCKNPGGPAPGAANDHCTEADGGMIKQVTGVCETESLDAGPVVDAGLLTSGGDYGATMFGSSGFDDDCKYHVTWTSTPICENNNVNFTVTATKTVGGAPLTGAAPYLEYYKIEPGGAPPHFDANEPLQSPTEEAGGKYVVGPLSFDQSGQWLIRFHFYEECSDDPDDSPHGHAAFYIDVP